LIDDSRGHAVGEIVYAETRKPADARLIAQAPAMFACLKQLLMEHDALCLANGSTEDRWTCAAWARKILADAGAA
jgi:hypothetical protein